MLILDRYTSWLVSNAIILSSPLYHPAFTKIKVLLGSSSYTLEFADNIYLSCKGPLSYDKSRFVKLYFKFSMLWIRPDDQLIGQSYWIFLGQFCFSIRKEKYTLCVHSMSYDEQ